VIADAEGNVLIGGIMEHIEEAGVHSGDSSCSLPPYSLSPQLQDELRRQASAMARELKVVGHMNTQFAIQGDTVYILEVNPRASRTVPFVSKATGVPLAKIAARVMAGRSLAELNATREVIPAYYSVKEAVFPFARFPGVDVILGPEMKSTGEVMGIDADFGTAFAKSQTAAYGSLPTSGSVFVSVANKDKRSLIFPVKRLADLGFRILATEGTAAVLRRNGITCQEVHKHSGEKLEAGERTIVEMIRDGEVDMVINTPYGNSGPRVDGYEIRSAAVAMNIPCVTTVQGASAAVQGIEAAIRGDIGVQSLQALHARLRSPAVVVAPATGSASS
jgi:carbamoyl-phosphate synthase large subunit